MSCAWGCYGQAWGCYGQGPGTGVLQPCTCTWRAHGVHTRTHMRMRMQHALRMQMCTCACQAKLERLRRLQPSRQEGAKATKAKRSARRRKLPATQPEAPPPPVDAQAQLN